MTSEELARAFGKRLRYWRKEKGFTQRQLAVAAGRSTNHVSVASWISNIEKGESRVSVDTMFRFARALDVDPTWLVDNLEKEL